MGMTLSERVEKRRSALRKAGLRPLSATANLSWPRKPI
jgi:hypothetical protein